MLLYRRHKGDTMRAHSGSDTCNELLKAYYASIQHIRLLDAEGERKLAEGIAKGDKLARQKLIEANLRLVVKIARAYPTSEMSLMDLISPCSATPPSST